MSHKLTLEHWREIASLRGGKCLSKRYIDAKTHLKWECSKGHIWTAKPSNIKTGYWCPFCAGNAKHNIETMKKLAESKGGKCISTIYSNNSTALKWLCGNDHTFYSTPSNVLSGRWCRKCSYAARGNSRKLGIEMMRKLASEKGGACLSIVYIDSHSDLLWRCAKNHEWSASPDRIVNQKSWCPYCSKGVSERICRAIMQDVFRHAFPTRRPQWLKSPSGKMMELDGYCEELGIAFEYHGEQHFLKSRMFSNKTSLIYRKKCDRLKRQLCALHGIILIEVPYTVFYDDMRSFIIREYERACGKKLKAGNPVSYLSLDFQPIDRMEALQKYAESKGGQCISNLYVNASTKLTWKCKRGHLWNATPNKVLNAGTWCPFCYGNVKLSINEMKVLAKEKGGECLSKKYKNAHNPLKWRCALGHTFSMSATYVKHSKIWCPVCSSIGKNIRSE